MVEDVLASSRCKKEAIHGRSVVVAAACQFLRANRFIRLVGREAVIEGGAEVTALMWTGGVIAGLLLVYLFTALLKPEWF